MTTYHEDIIVPSCDARSSRDLRLEMRVSLAAGFRGISEHCQAKLLSPQNGELIPTLSFEAHTTNIAIFSACLHALRI